MSCADAIADADAIAHALAVTCADASAAHDCADV